MVDLHDLKTLAPFGHNVHAAIRIFFRHGDNLCCASDLGNSIFFGTDDAKSFL